MKNWIADTQHGFRTGEGCEELLSHLVKKVEEMLKTKKIGEDGKQIKGIQLYSMISKAFDTWTPGILFKLYRAGIRGRLYFWLKYYLENRKQVVKVGNEV